MERVRRVISINFACALVVAAAVFIGLIVAGLQDTTPTGQQVSRSPLGGSVLLLFEAILAYLYCFKRAELAGLVRVFAAVLGVVGLLQSIVVPLVVHELYGYPFMSWENMTMWYVYGSHLAYALIGSPLSPSRTAIESTRRAVSDSEA